MYSEQFIAVRREPRESDHDQYPMFPAQIDVGIDDSAEALVTMTILLATYRLVVVRSRMKSEAVYCTR